LSTTTRTVRFTKEEIRDIESFLKQNPFFDFSALTRLAVAEYIRNPKLQVTPINLPQTKKKIIKQENSHV
jgi:hypothetical protein